MIKKLLFIIVSIMFLIPSVSATNYQYGVSKNERKLIEEEEKHKSFIKDLSYRFVEKENHDTLDYTYLFIVIGLMIIVIIFLNKKTYVSFRDNSIFEDEEFINKKGL